jgi:hypothetical protein
MDAASKLPPQAAQPTLEELLARCDLARLHPTRLQRVLASANQSTSKGPRSDTAA